MSTKHTPGPWISAEAISSVVGLPVVKSGPEGGRLICNVNCAADPIHGKMPGDDAFNREALSNARLIAAAPELLNALRPFVRHPKEWGLTEIQAANRAIAKAEGRS